MNCPKCRKKIKSKKDLKACPFCGAELVPADGNAAEEKPADSNAAEEKPADSNAAEEKPADGNTAEEKPADGNTAEEKPAEENTADVKSAEEGSADEKAAITETQPGESQDPASSGAAPEDESQSDEEENEEEKRSKKPLIIALICVLVIGIGVAAAIFFLRSKGGNSSVRAAAEEDAKMFKSKDWSPFLDSVSDDDWDMIYDHYKDRLKPVGIKNASKLKDEVKVRMRSMGNFSSVKSIEILDELKTDEGTKPGLVEDVTGDEFYLESKKLAGQWVSETRTDGEVKTVLFYYYERDGKWYSGCVLKLAAVTAEEFADDGREVDIKSAQKIAETVAKVLKSKKVKKEISKYKGEVAITARSGKKFAPVAKAKLKNLAGLVNKNLPNEYNEISPQIRHTGTSQGWTIKAWAVTLDENGEPVVYVTDGTLENKMELYPNVDKNY